MASTNPARGMRDFMPSDVRKRDHVIGIIKEVYESHGFKSVEGSERSFFASIDEADGSVEVRAILAVNETLTRLGVKNFAIYISHSEVLAGILETVRVPRELHKSTFEPIRAFSKFNVEGFVNELQEIGVSESASTVLADLFLNTDAILNQEHDINRTVVTNLLNIVSNETLTELGQILQLTGRTQVLIDPALACTEPYSRGIVMEARTSGLDILGEGGWIEDNAPEDSLMFAFSFDIETVLDLIENGDGFPPEITMSNSAAVL